MLPCAAIKPKGADGIRFLVIFDFCVMSLFWAKTSVCRLKWSAAKFQFVNQFIIANVIIMINL